MSLKILKQLRRQKSRVVFAESCTGGLAAHLIAQISGASDVLEAGFVTYSNDAKIVLLGVKSSTLKKYGAVSEEVALEMALGALKRVPRANRSVAITGIAGPKGAVAGKPVGTVWIAAVIGKHRRTAAYCFSGSRVTIQKKAALAALELLTSPVYL